LNKNIFPLVATRNSGNLKHSGVKYNNIIFTLATPCHMAHVEEIPKKILPYRGYFEG